MKRLPTRQNELVKRLRAGAEIQTMHVHPATWQALVQRGAADVCPDTCLLRLTPAYALSPRERRSRSLIQGDAR
jgi:hypothetical protein